MEKENKKSLKKNSKVISSKDKKCKPEIEIVELVCQNTPDWTHGTIGW